MNPASTLTIVSSVLAVAIALLAWGVARAPSYRAMRYLAVSSLLAACFSLANIGVTLTARASVLVPLGRVSLSMASFWGAGWTAFGAAQRGRRMTRFERGLSLGALAFGLAALVPGWLVSNEVLSRPVPWLGLVYTDAVPTPAGMACYFYYWFSLASLLVKYVVDRRTVALAPRAHILGFSALVITGLNDSLAASGVTRLPYLLDVGLSVLVLSVGGALTARFVSEARAREVAVSQLRDAQAELVARERLAAVGELSAVVAHEVRNPLAIIFNAVAGLRKVPIEAVSGHRLLSIVQEESHRLNRIVTDLLDFSRPQPPQRRATSMPQLVATAIDAVSTASEGAPEAFDFECTDDFPSVSCDPHMVRQAVINLLQNAVQATARSRPVRVRMALAAGRVEVRVIDDGAGVAPEVASKVFAPFFTTRAMGTGLGLSIVQRVAELHGGDVSHEPTPGGGATFVLRLRCGAPEAA